MRIPRRRGRGAFLGYFRNKIAPAGPGVGSGKVQSRFREASVAAQPRFRAESSRANWGQTPHPLRCPPCNARAERDAARRPSSCRSPHAVGGLTSHAERSGREGLSGHVAAAFATRAALVPMARIPAARGAATHMRPARGAHTARPVVALHARGRRRDGRFGRTGPAQRPGAGSQPPARSQSSQRRGQVEASPRSGFMPKPCPPCG